MKVQLGNQLHSFQSCILSCSPSLLPDYCQFLKRQINPRYSLVGNNMIALCVSCHFSGLLSLQPSHMLLRRPPQLLQSLVYATCSHEAMPMLTLSALLTFLTCLLLYSLLAHFYFSLRVSFKTLSSDNCFLTLLGHVTQSSFR